jgi:hypothetical protein
MAMSFQSKGTIMKGIGLVKLQIKDLGAIKEVTVDFLPGINVFQGVNGVGKSTILNAIKFAFDGKGAIPDRIIRRGAERALVEVETTDFTVELELYDGKNGQTPKLVVKKNGFVKSGPQEFLNGFLAEFSDPSEISRFKPSEIYELLMQYANIDTSDVESEIEKYQEEQTFLRRKIKEIGKMDAVNDSEPVDTTLTVSKINEIVDFNSNVDRQINALAELSRTVDRAVDDVEGMHEEIRLLEEELAGKVSKLSILVDKRDEAMRIARMASQPQEKKDPSPYQRDLEDAQERNRKHEAYLRYKEWEKKVADTNATFEANKAEIAKLEDKKQKLFTEAVLPVDGLRVSEEKEVFYRTIAWKNLSEAERLILSAKLIVNSTPENAIRYMVIHQGESILSKLRNELNEYLVESDFTCLMQVASESTPPDMPGYFHIVEGRIQEESECPVIQ